MEGLYLETDKQKLEKLENLYEMVMDFEKKSHEKNRGILIIHLSSVELGPFYTWGVLHMKDYQCSPHCERKRDKPYR